MADVAVLKRYTRDVAHATFLMVGQGATYQQIMSAADDLADEMERKIAVARQEPTS